MGGWGWVRALMAGGCTLRLPWLGGGGGGGLDEEVAAASEVGRMGRQPLLAGGCPFAAVQLGSAAGSGGGGSTEGSGRHAWLAAGGMRQVAGTTRGGVRCAACSPLPVPTPPCCAQEEEEEEDEEEAKEEEGVADEAEEEDGEEGARLGPGHHRVEDGRQWTKQRRGPTLGATHRVSLGAGGGGGGGARGTRNAASQCSRSSPRAASGCFVAVGRASCCQRARSPRNPTPASPPSSLPPLINPAVEQGGGGDRGAGTAEGGDAGAGPARGHPLRPAARPAGPPRPDQLRVFLGFRV